MHRRRFAPMPIAQPRVTSITPSTAPPAGGSTHTVAGSFLETTNAVWVGGTAAAFTLSGGVLTFTAPALAGATYPVEVQTSGGAARLYPGLQVAIVAPTVSTIAPSSGPVAGAQSVTITGSSFTGATSAAINGVNVTSFAVVNDSTITGVTPSGTAGARNVTVTGPGGTGTLTNGYTYVAAPTVTSVSPNRGPLAGGQSVTITGTNLTGATSVTFGGVAATSVVVVNSTTITCTTPAGSAGLASVAVTTIGGTGSNGSAYTYAAAPVVSSVSPDAGRTNQTQAVTITGTGFTGATAVTFGGNAATSITVVNDTTITCTTPTGTAGSQSVQVTTPAGSGSASAYFYLDATALELWFRADRGVTQASNRVSAWTNGSGSADANRNLSQSTGANQPRLVSSDANFNNQPTIGTQTGTDEELNMASGGAWSASIAAPQTMYLVCRAPTGYGNNIGFVMGPAQGYSGGTAFNLAAGTVNVSNDGANIITTAMASNTTYVVCAVFNGASSAIYLSRHTTAATTGNAGSTAVTSTFIGSFSGFPTRWVEAEMVTYAAAHGQAKRQEIMTYLGTRYGVTVTA